MMASVIVIAAFVALANAPAPAAASTSSSSSSSSSSAAVSEAMTLLPMPGGTAGIGFDDMAYAPALDQVIVPSGATMKVELVDAKTKAIVASAVLPPVPAEGAKGGGHDDGTTSAVYDAAHKLFVASDRTRKVVDVFDGASRALLSSTPLAAGPDYVRVNGNEVWVTEPHAKQIEVFAIGADKKLTKTAAIAFPDGPESLVFDDSGNRAYTHAWKSQTYAIDAKGHAVTATWNNTCSGSRGIAFDAASKLVVVGCAEGKVVALDAATGAVKGTLQAPVNDVDIIGWSPQLRHVYVPGARTMAIVGMKKDASLSVLATVPTAEEAHCAVADDHAQVWVCDPTKGRIIVVKDSAPPQ